MKYEAPSITPLGSVSEFTQGSWDGSTYDGQRFVIIPLTYDPPAGNPSVS